MATALAVLALGACSEGASTAEAAGGETQGEMVTAVGCPITPEPGCVTIAAGGEAYDISDAGVDLSRGVGVSLSGRAAGEVTSCGAKLTDVNVEYLGLQCGPPPEAAAG